MADLPLNFWSGWVATITLVSFIGLVYLVFSIFFGSDEHTESADHAEPVWDENLREGQSAPPMWWFWLIFSAMIFSVAYLMLYPGFGGFKGMLNWSQEKRLSDSFISFEENFAQARERIAASSLSELQGDAELMATAQGLFSRQCAACHGEEGRGQANLFPNLMDVDWQWGGDASAIEQTIRHGRNAMMPAWQPMLQDEGVQAVANYVQNISAADASEYPGKQQYDQFCVACHGADGTGNPMLGAPNLADDTWLYGGDIEAIAHSIGQGRSGRMPAFGERLDDVQIKLLVALLAR
ncbi:MAG: cytochrome-c oxidase, cbb3-type subunit III [Pseudohongiellaceae bacterium]|nr:cytochrome-c oxidase, cbb3-type subunit III [Pseudohongiellaceae bacterium]